MLRQSFRSQVGDCAIHGSGWWPIAPGLEITKLPVIDDATGLFAHLGHGPAGRDVAPQFNARLPTFAEYEALHKACKLRLEPYSLPNIEQRAAEAKRLGVPRLSQAQEQDLRMREMMGREWCEVHDREMWHRLEAWDGVEPVDNVGKHWAQGGGIIGWWTPNAHLWGVSSPRMIQEPSMRHQRDPGYDDYATNFHLVRKVA